MEFSNEETVALHHGYRSDPSTGAVCVPIYQNTAYELQGELSHVADVYNVRADGFTYTRIINPTTRVLERRFAKMDHGVDSLAVATGQAATFVALANLLSGKAGNNIIASPYMYGNSWNLLNNTFARLGVEARMAASADPGCFEELIDDNTIALFGESISNPILVPLPIREISEIGRKYGIPLVVDNTVAPLIGHAGQLGAAVSIYSATKYICGHGTTMGGLIVDHGKFDFTDNDRFPLFNNPDDAHGDIIWAQACNEVNDLGKSEMLLKARMTWLRDTGGAISPYNSFQLIQGVETLPLRMKKHCENAGQVADMLSQHPKVKSLVYPGHFIGRKKEIADEFFDASYGYGPMIMFDVEGGIEAGKRVIENVKLLYHVSNVGDARSLITHPVSTTHTTVPREKRMATGINDGSIRLCVGIENPDDIIADLEQAFRHI